MRYGAGVCNVLRMTTTVQYRIHNLSGVTTHHCARFTNGVRDGWRQTQTLDALLADLHRAPWVSAVRVNGETVKP